MTRHTTLAAIAVLALTACAPSPDSIAPISMPSGMYDRLTCQQARAERAQIGQTIAALEASQRAAAAGDAFGVFLIGVPVSSLTGGNQAGLIAAERGKALALDARLVGC
jgi:hypothetical protein